MREYPPRRPCHSGYGEALQRDHTNRDRAPQATCGRRDERQSLYDTDEFPQSRPLLGLRLWVAFFGRCSSVSSTSDFGTCARIASVCSKVRPRCGGSLEAAGCLGLDITHSVARYNSSRKQRFGCAPGWTRTSIAQFSGPALFPVELRGHGTESNASSPGGCLHKHARALAFYAARRTRSAPRYSIPSRLPRCMVIRAY